MQLSLALHRLLKNNNPQHINREKEHPHGRRWLLRALFQRSEHTRECYLLFATSILRETILMFLCHPHFREQYCIGTKHRRLPATSQSKPQASASNFNMSVRHDRYKQFSHRTKTPPPTQTHHTYLKRTHNRTPSRNYTNGMDFVPSYHKQGHRHVHVLQWQTKKKEKKEKKTNTQTAADAPFWPSRRR